VVCLTFELPFAMIDLALKTARGCGTKVVLNAAPSRSAVELTDLCFTGVTSLIVNELEARSLFGPSATPEDETARISAFTQRHGIELVCVTRGARGCSYWYAQQLDHQPGFPITARNTAGAGDAFAATLALYRACGYQPAAAIRSACAAGALAAESPGTLSSMPTDQQLHRRLAEWSEVEPAAAVRPIPDQSSESPGQLVTHE
jgi:sugar/nucleoside kinase (ribokinase family)